jgi:hypothetical protein
MWILLLAALAAQPPNLMTSRDILAFASPAPDWKIP